VLGTECRTRKSWAVWEEDGKYPNVIFDVLSDSTAKADKTTKKQTYQDIFRTPEYFLVDPVTSDFEGFVLMAEKYQAIEPNSNGHLWSRQLDLHVGIYESQLRFFTAEGDLVPTPPEAAKQVQQQADRLAARLRELGVDPDSM
jgi:Uma2 family endonuclease